jgi:uncharacterized membrane protein
MTYSPVLIVHICGGIIGVLSGSTALLVRKGSLLHRRSGDVFVISMLSMAAAGAYVAFTKSQPSNVVAGVFTIYLVATAWLTVMRKENETGHIEFGLLLVGLAAGISSLILGWDAAHSATGSKAEDFAVPYFIFGSAAVLAIAGDIRMLIRGGVSGAKRLVRHLWRMCVALFIAAGSFFLGTASDPVLRRTGLRATLFTAEIRKTHLPEVPVLIIVILTIFWLCRVWFTGGYKTPKTKVSVALPPTPAKDAGTSHVHSDLGYDRL